MDELINTLAVPNSSRGRERLARILEAATELFLRDGYGETSIDAILAVSGGSKATLYNYFPTKDDLFRAVIDEVLSSAKEPRLDTSVDARATLTAFASERLEVLFSTRHNALLRLIVAERERFPDLARMYYERGPLRIRHLLADYLAELERRQVLTDASAEEAAEFLIGMLAHWWVVEALLLGGSPSVEAIRERTTRVVDCFLNAFGR